MAEHVRLTDLVLSRIQQQLAAHPPERGAALLAVSGLVHDLVEDTAGDYTGVRWRISEELSGLVQAAEQQQRGVFAGHVHTHPDGVPDPSAADLDATVRMLHLEQVVTEPDTGVQRTVSNAHLDELVICVVSRGVPRATDLAVGDEHRMSVHVMRRGPGGSGIVRRARAEIVPIGADLDAVGVDVADHGLSVTWRGTKRLGLPVGESDERLLCVSRDYPLSGPLLLAPDSEDGLAFAGDLRWDPTLPAAPQLSSLLAAADQRCPPGFGARIEGLVGQLAGTRVVVAGLGSVGSWLLEELVRAGVGHLDLLDPERVEGPNLSRTIYEVDHLGVPKVDAAAQLCRRINPAVEICTHYTDIAGIEDQLSTLCARADLVVAATDDPTGQALLNHHAYHAGTPLIACGLYRRAEAGEVVVVVPGLDTACWCCATGPRSGEGQGVKDYGTGRLAAELALGPAIHLVTEVAAGVALGLLAGPDAPAGQPLRDLLLAGQTMGMVTTAPQWGFFPALFEGIQGHQWAPQSIWARVERPDDCTVCGSTRVAPATGFGRDLSAVVARQRLDLAAGTPPSLAPAPAD